ncbi:serpin family protein [Thermotoga profunda]|uniref:serpin family protein n=1 Tax=Thermotoga profunda TaxID=1508420 RepID=UPI00059746D6|nr:serpin family protein [Thermotoga profunda]
MKKVLFIVFLTGFVAIVGFGTVEKSSNLFGIELYKVLSRNPGNVFFSPFSISSALAMTYIGASGDTARQMRQVLHFNLDDEVLHSDFSQLITSLNQPNENYELSVANSMWAQDGYPFLEGFIEQVQKYYQAGINYVDFVFNRDEARQKINTWVEEKTNHKIKDIIKPDDIDELTRLVLTNAVYFKGYWENSFDASSTKKEPFYISKDEKKEVDMMYQNMTTKYAEDSLVQVLELPYTGKNLSMVVVLPKNNMEEVERELSLDLFEEWLRNLRLTEVKVYLPRFKMECRFNLKQTLMNMGMTDAFSMSADFSKMDGTKKLRIKDVIHQSFVDVNEKGTEAAAATAVIINVKMSPTMPVVFKADRPFLFFVYDKTHNLILFMGRLVNP